MRKVILGFVGVSVALAAGCNNDSNAPIEFDELTTRVGGAYCGYAMRCGSTSSIEQFLLHSTITSCGSQTGTYLANTQFARYQEAINGGTIVYDSASAGRCLSAFETADCATVLSGAPAGCDTTFRGTVADGGSCTLSEECEGDSTCVGAGAGCGTCMHTPQIGESCTTNCATGAWCNAGTCAAQIAQGGACTPGSSNACAGSSTCVAPETDPTHGTCSAAMRAGEGQPCGSAGCEAGLVCGITGAMTVCRAARTDGTCQGVISGSDCASGTTCSAGIGMNGTCGPYPALGAACAGVCAAPARCVHMMCHPSGELGVPCEGADDCLSGVCDAGICAPQPLCTP